MDPLRHGEFLYDYFMTIALIHQRSLAWYSVYLLLLQS